MEPKQTGENCKNKGWTGRQREAEERKRQGGAGKAKEAEKARRSRENKRREGNKRDGKERKRKGDGIQKDKVRHYLFTFLSKVWEM